MLGIGQYQMPSSLPLTAEALSAGGARRGLHPLELPLRFGAGGVAAAALPLAVIALADVAEHVARRLADRHRR
ncbi:MAG: hypothetical protein ACXW3P_08205, partial [Rhodospirillales bacterium]